MRIAISGMFWPQPNTDNGQYLRYLLEQLVAQTIEHRFILIAPRYLNPPKPTLPRIQFVAMPTPFDQRLPGFARWWFEQIAINQVCFQLSADVLHVPYFGAPLYPAVPTLVNVHDLGSLLLPKYRNEHASRLAFAVAARSIRRASLVIADSHYIKQQIVNQLNVLSAQICVVPQAAAPSFQLQSKEEINGMLERFRINGPYVYYAGGFDARKNVTTVIKAFARVRQNSDHDVQLVIAGRWPNGNNPLYPDIHRVILEEQVAAQVALIGDVSETEHAALLSGCQAFLFPSHYESFGLRPLEAMQCGAAVLASATTGVGEVVGDGGILLPPDDIDGWAAALAHLLNDNKWRAELQQRALERASCFGWEKTARQTIALYEQCSQT